MGGVTEFLLYSHRDGTNCTALEEKAPPRDRLVSTEGLSAGDIVILDVRLCHRGLLHTGPVSSGLGEIGVRPVAALSFGIDEWVDKEDTNNWGSKYLVPGARKREGEQKEDLLKMLEDIIDHSKK